MRQHQDGRGRRGEGSRGAYVGEVFAWRAPASVRVSVCAHGAARGAGRGGNALMQREGGGVGGGGVAVHARA